MLATASPSDGGLDACPLNGERARAVKLAVMRSFSQLAKLGIENMRSVGLSPRLTLGYALIVALGVHGGAAAAPPPFKDLCKAASQNAMRSCQDGAKSDYSLALGKCNNLSDSGARAQCRQQAADDLKDAMGTCQDQLAARQVICERLGPAPYDPTIDPANFVAQINNPFFPLSPGTTFVYEGQTAEGLEHEEFFVTTNTKVILGVTCIEVRDIVKLNGELIEDTLDWFAQDTDGNVWYMGENAKQLEGGLIIGVEGSWTAGVDGAKPGIVMKAHPAVGDFYRQEFSLGTAEDVGEVVSLIEPVAVPPGSFSNCVKTRDTTPLEPDVVELKFYAPGTGLVLEIDTDTGERLELIQITH